MQEYNYLIIGGGLAGDAAVRGIRELDSEGSIGMLSLEPYPPYTRPHLSKNLWKGSPVEKIWRNTQSLGVDLHLNSQAVRFDPKNKIVGMEDGVEFAFTKLLLATGGTPIRLPFGEQNILYYRDFYDYQRLRLLSESGDQFLVIGGGFIGSELAAALNMNGKKVTMLFPEGAIGAAVYPDELAQFLNEFYRQKGVEVVTGDQAAGLEKTGTQISVHTKKGRVFKMDGAVAGIGIRPNVELAQQAGLQVDNGIVVNEQLMTSAVDVYAAGDVANFYHAALLQRMRVEHEDNAVTMGKLAGRNMAGAGEVYTHTPMFYSDLFELGYEAVGELSSKLETFTDWKERFKKGVIYYLKDGRVRGVLLWNVWGALPKARELLTAPMPFRIEDLKGKI